jgi:hypothetical protein
MELVRGVLGRKDKDMAILGWFYGRIGFQATIGERAQGSFKFRVWHAITAIRYNIIGACGLPEALF